MRVEERCCCGAEIKLTPESYNLTRQETALELDRVARALDQWRRMHKPCRGGGRVVTMSDASPSAASTPMGGTAQST